MACFTGGWVEAVPNRRIGRGAVARGPMIKRNLLANYSGTLVVAGTQILTIPLYLRHLGEHDWGVLSVLLALAATLLIFEAGFSQSVARGVAEGASRTGNIERDSFLRTESRYFAVTAVGAAALFAVSSGLGSLLFRNSTSASTALVGMAIGMASAQIMGSLYRGALIGRGAQVRFNVLLVVMTVLRHAAGISVAAAGHGVLAVAGVMAASYALECGLRRWAVNPLLSARSPADLQAPTSAGHTTPPPADSGAKFLALAGVLGALATQIDRLVIGSAVGAEALGHYAIGATLSLAVLQFVYPISNALMPRLKSFDRRSGSAGVAMMHTYGLLGGLLLAVWLLAGAFVVWGLQEWLPPTVSGNAAEAVWPLFLLHLAGTTLNALCIPLHLRLLAEHRDRAILQANAFSLLCLVTVLGLLVASLQALAGSLAWIAFNAALLASYTLASRTTRP